MRESGETSGRQNRNAAANIVNWRRMKKTNRRWHGGVVSHLLSIPPVIDIINYPEASNNNNNNIIPTIMKVWGWNGRGREK